jgi:DNA mismatch endonuclease (patch repair protein)
MRRIKSKDSKPEMLIRRMVHGMGYRYRLHRKDLPGKPDLVFPGIRKVIFVHGCFWHCHDDPACRDGRLPKSRQEYWVPKLKRNRQRDSNNIAALEDLGWSSLVIWECETRDAEKVKTRLRKFLGGRVKAPNIR